MPHDDQLEAAARMNELAEEGGDGRAPRRSARRSPPSASLRAGAGHKRSASHHAHPRTSPPLELLQRYDMSAHTVGRGHFSVVKLGVDRRTNERVAIKVIDKRTLHSEARLRTEVAVLQRAGRHEHIVQLLDVFENAEALFLVMELVQGGELFGRIVAKTRYSEAEAREAIAQIASALEYLHRRGVVHRDLKPENLLYASAAEHSPLKIADFGLARAFEPADGARLSSPCGTPGYVAPEVLTHNGYDGAVDLWSLGVILYVLLCGHPPFYAQTTAKLFDKIKRAEYGFPDAQWRHISDDAKDLVRHLLTLEPAHRLTAREVLQHRWVRVAGAASAERVLTSPQELAYAYSQRLWGMSLELSTAVHRLGNFAALPAIPMGALWARRRSEQPAAQQQRPARGARRSDASGGGGAEDGGGGGGGAPAPAAAPASAFALPQPSLLAPPSLSTACAWAASPARRAPPAEAPPPRGTSTRDTISIVPPPEATRDTISIVPPPEATRDTISIVPPPEAHVGGAPAADGGVAAWHTPPRAPPRGAQPAASALALAQLVPAAAGPAPPPPPRREPPRAAEPPRAPRAEPAAVVTPPAAPVPAAPRAAMPPSLRAVGRSESLPTQLLRMSLFEACEHGGSAALGAAGGAADGGGGGADGSPRARMRRVNSLQHQSSAAAAVVCRSGGGLDCATASAEERQRRAAAWQRADGQQHQPVSAA